MESAVTLPISRFYFNNAISITIVKFKPLQNYEKKTRIG